MRILFSAILVALLLSFGLVTVMQKDPGYVLFSYANKTYEMSVWVALFLYFALSLFLYVLVRVCVHLLAPRGKINRWLGQRTQRQRHDTARQGMLAYMEGDWSAAQKLLSKSAKSSDSPLLSYLLAARVSQELGEPETSYQLLRQAEQSGENRPLAIGLTQAQLQLATGRLEDCVATLLKLKKTAPKHLVLQKMLVEVYTRLDDWPALYALLPELKKQKVFAESKYAELHHQCVVSLLQAASHKSLTELESQWAKLSSAEQKDARVVAMYARGLLANQSAQQAEKILRVCLKRDWDDELVDLYGLTAAADADKQMLLAESWLKQRPNNAKLLRCLGRIAFRNELWEKSKEYFLASLDLHKSAETYVDLAILMAKLGKHQQSAEYFTLGMQNTNTSISRFANT